MTGVTTAVPAAQDALLALVAAACADVDLAAAPMLGTPSPDQVTGSGVWVWLPLTDPGQAHSQKWGLSGLSARQEAFQQDVVVYTRVRSVDAADARTAADSAVTPILAALSTDVRLGGVVEMAHATAVTREEAAPERTVREMAATITVQLSAWLTS